MKAGPWEDPVFDAVDTLRSAIPPEANATVRHGDRERALKGLQSLAKLLPSFPLIPMQLEVIFRNYRPATGWVPSTSRFASSAFHERFS